MYVCISTEFMILDKRFLNAFDGIRQSIVNAEVYTSFVFLILI